MSWVNNRKATIEEDQAYCLLGNFEVHTPLIYGEGWKNAFRRLREVAKFTSKHEPFSIRSRPSLRRSARDPSVDSR